jgi:hypothetical protein
MRAKTLVLLVVLFVVSMLIGATRAPTRRAPASEPAPCAEQEKALGGIEAVELPAADPSAAADRILANLGSVAPLAGAIDRGAACVETRIPTLADPRFRQKFYRFPNGTLWLKSELDYLVKVGKPSVQNLVKTYGDLKAFRADADGALTASVSFRESGALAWTAKDALVNSHSSGGLDFLGMNLGTLHARYLPPGYGDSWTPGENCVNEAHDNCQGAMLPQRDLPAAYGAWLLMSKDAYESSALKYGFTRAELDGLSIDARRVWIALYFGVSGGYEYAPGRHGFPGAVTVLTHLKSLIADGKAASLEDILTSSELYAYTQVRLATAVAGNAAIFERLTGLR